MITLHFVWQTFGKIKASDFFKIVIRQRAVREQRIYIGNELRTESEATYGCPSVSRARRSQMEPDNLMVGSVDFLIDDAVSELKPLPFALPHRRGKEE